MPLTQAQRAALPQHLRHFTNRSEQLAAFETLWQNQTPFLAFDGMSGNGKTTLISVLIEAFAKPQHIAYTYLDFDDPGGAYFRQSAESLCSALVLSHSLKLPAVTIQAYKSRRDESLARLSQRKAEITISQSTTAGNGGEVAHSGQTAQLNLADVIERFEREARAEIGAAALDALQAHANRRCLIFLDTMERLMAEADPHHRDWLWGWLHQAISRYPHLRIVMGGRRSLKLGRGQSCQHHLPDLSPADSDTLLARLGVTDPAWRQAVYDRLARGHPFTTEMAGELWQTLGQNHLPVDNIPRLAGHDKAIDWLTGKILERLPEPLRSAARWAALLRYFTTPILQASLPPDLPPLTATDFDRLRAFSFVEPTDRLDGSYTCHSMLRRVQSRYLRQHEPGPFKAFHHRAAACFDQQGEELESLYHHLAAGDDEAFEEWNRKVNRAGFTWDWPTWGALLDLADSPELALPPAWQGRMLEKRGWWRYRRGDIQLALDTCRQAIKLLTQANDETALSYTYNNIGLIHKARGDYDQALHFYQQSVAIQEKLGDQSGLATSYNNIGLIYDARGDYDQALHFYQQSVAIKEKLGDQSGLATSYSNIGSIHYARGDYDQALHFYQQSVAIQEKLGDQSGLATSYNNIGLIHKARGDYDQALHFYQQSVAIQEKLGDQSGLATSYNNIGLIYDARGDYDQALHFYQQSVAIKEKLGDQSGLATSYSNIGSIHYARGDYDQALHFYQQSVAITEKLGNVSGLAYSYNNIAFIYQARDNLGQAVSYFEKSLDIFERIGERANAATVRENLAAARAMQQGKEEEK